MKNVTTKQLTTAAMLIALSTAISLVCALIPFLNLPFGGGFTIAGMLPVVLISYLYGVPFGLCSAFLYALIQVVLGMFGDGYVISLFTIGSDDYMGIAAGIGVLVLDYLIAYTVLGFGGAFRRRGAWGLVFGVLLALSLRYLVHIVSGVIFFGTWAEWFFSQEGFYAIGQVILDHISGFWLSLIYAVFYNGLYMIPEIVITAICARVVAEIPMIRQVAQQNKRRKKA